MNVCLWLHVAVAAVALVALVVVVAVVIVRRRRAAANAQPDAESNYTENSASLPEILNPACTSPSASTMYFFFGMLITMLRFV